MNLRLLASIGLLTLSNCPVGAAVEQVTNIALRFEARVGQQGFVCGNSYEGIGVTGSKITPSDFRFYVSAVSLVNAQGRRLPVALLQDGIWQYQDVALLDFEDGKDVCRNGNAALNTEVRGTVPKDSYRGVEFTLGLPFELNHGDATIAPSPLNFSAMFWSWQGGYRFLKIDLASSGQGQGTAAESAMAADHMAQDKSGATPRAAGFPIHLGSDGCAGTSRTAAPSARCKFANLVTVRFDVFDPERNVVVADLGALLDEVNVDVNAARTAPGCMGASADADCANVFANLGLRSGGGSPGRQRFFRIGE